MKHTILALIMLIAFPNLGKCDNSLSVKNNTNHPISVAIVWYNHGRQYWEGQGWFQIAAYGTETFQLHPYDLGSTTMYVGAMNGRKSMGGQSKFKVDKANAFDIADADKVGARDETIGFSPVIVHNGDTEFVVQE